MSGTAVGSDWLIVIAPPLLALLLLPFFINVHLAKSRGKSIPLTLLATLAFSWLATLVLAGLPTRPLEGATKEPSSPRMTPS